MSSEMSSQLCSKEPDSGSTEPLPPEKPEENLSCEVEEIEREEPGISPLSVDAQNGLSAGDDETAKTHEVHVDLDGAVKVDRPVSKDAVSGRERLKRHRTEVAGRVWIPDIWGQEDLLKDWVDCASFDSGLVMGDIVSARAALVRANTTGLRIENRC